MSTTPAVVLALADSVQLQIASAVCKAHRLDVTALPKGANLERGAGWNHRPDRTELWIVELDRLHEAQLRPHELVARLSTDDPIPTLLLSNSRRALLSPLEEKWARDCGAVGLLASMSPDRFKSSVDERLSSLLIALGAGEARAVAASFVRLIPATSPSRAAHVVQAHKALAELERSGISSDAVARWASSAQGFDVRNREWRLANYEAVFVGSEAIDRMTAYLKCDRDEAVVFGELLRQARAFRHVTNDHAFEDANYFYRLTPTPATVASLDLRMLIERAQGKGGFPRADRPYLGKTYDDCFVGGEAVEWLVANYGLDEEAAILVGQMLIDVSLVEHVTSSHEWRNGHYFYRWRGFATEAPV